MTRPDETLLTITVPAWWVAEQSEDVESVVRYYATQLLLQTTPAMRENFARWGARWTVVEDALNVALTESGR